MLLASSFLFLLSLFHFHCLHHHHRCKFLTLIWNDLNVMSLRGHSNTWHFVGAFLTPPVWHYSTFKHWFLGLHCFEIPNKFETKYLWSLFLVCDKKLIPKALKTPFQRAKKACVTFYHPPPPFRECHVWPLILFSLPLPNVCYLSFCSLAFFKTFSRQPTVCFRDLAKLNLLMVVRF